MKNELFFQLIDRYLDGTATPEERDLLDRYYFQLTQGREALDAEEEESLRTEVLARILAATVVLSEPRQGERVDQDALPRPKVLPLSRRRMVRWLAAAVFLLAVTGIWFLNRDANKQTLMPDISVRYGNDVSPGRDTAVLQLADGSSITLSGPPSSKLATQGGAVISNEGGDAGL